MSWGKKAGFLSFQYSTASFAKMIILRKTTLTGLISRLAASSLTWGHWWRPGPGVGDEGEAAERMHTVLSRKAASQVPGLPPPPS